MCIHWSRKKVAKETFVNPMTTLGCMSNKAEKEYIGPNCLHESLTFGKWQSYWSALFCFSWYHECCYVLFFSISATFVFLFKLLPCACLVYCNSIPIKKLKIQTFANSPTISMLSGSCEAYVWTCFALNFKNWWSFHKPWKLSGRNIPLATARSWI